MAWLLRAVWIRQDVFVFHYRTVLGMGVEEDVWKECSTLHETHLMILIHAPFAVYASPFLR